MKKQFTDREQKLSGLLNDINTKVDDIMSEFDEYTTGVRFICLLQRAKDGGAATEDKRVFESYVTFSSSEFKAKLFNLLLLQSVTENTRIYSCVNARSTSHIIKEMHNALVEQCYADEECKYSISTKLIKQPRSYVMSPRTKTTSNFIIDVDNIEGKDVMGEVLNEMERLNLTELSRHTTKNGWHIVVEPFNPADWKHDSEIKKDALLLLNY